jgi:hypothetical protein
MWPAAVVSLDGGSSELPAGWPPVATTSIISVAGKILTRIINPEAEARPEQALASH